MGCWAVGNSLLIPDAINLQLHVSVENKKSVDLFLTVRCEGVIVREYFFAVEVGGRCEVHFPRSARTAVPEHHLTILQVDSDNAVGLVGKFVLSDILVEGVDGQVDCTNIVLFCYHTGDDERRCRWIPTSGSMVNSHFAKCEKALYLHNLCENTMECDRRMSLSC